MAEASYRDGCQCGAVRFNVAADLDHAVSCNCSRCSRIGSIFAFTPTAKFELVTGADSLTDFRFNKHVIHHLFCRTCSVESFAQGTAPDGGAMVAVNARCLDGVDPDTLHPRKHDGRSA